MHTKVIDKKQYIAAKGEPIIGEPCFVNGKFVRTFTEYHWRSWLQHKTYNEGPNPIQRAALIKTKQPWNIN